MLTLRVVALYRNVRWLVSLVWISFAIFQGLSVVIYIRYGIALYGEFTFSQLHQRTDFVYAEVIEYSPLSNICVVRKMSYRAGALIAVSTAYDFLLLVLTAGKVMRSPISLKDSPIVRVWFWLSACGILR